MAVDVTVPLPGGDPGRFLRSEPDEALVELVRAANEAAFEAIYDRHHRGLLAFCRHMLASREEAEDALQHTFAAAYRALTGAGERPRALKPWLYAIARNRCISVLRMRRPDEAGPACDEEADAPAIEGLADAVQRRADLRDLVADIHRLPDDQRAALVLFELGDHSHAEIAAVLCIDRAKVKALVFQAREGLLKARTARDTPCAEVRRHLSSRTRMLPRRGVIRGHLDRCPACAAYDLEVRRQRAALALVLPVAPSLELKGSILGPLLGGGATVAGGGAVVAGGAGGSIAGGAGAAAPGAAGAAGASAAGVGGAAGAAGAGAGAAGAGGAGAAAAGASGGFASMGAAGGFAGASAAGGLGALAAKAVVAKVVTIVAVAGAAVAAHHAGRPVHHAHRHSAKATAVLSAPRLTATGGVAAPGPVVAPAVTRPAAAAAATVVVAASPSVPAPTTTGGATAASAASTAPPTASSSTTPPTAKTGTPGSAASDPAPAASADPTPASTAATDPAALGSAGSVTPEASTPAAAPDAAPPDPGGTPATPGDSTAPAATAPPADACPADPAATTTAPPPDPAALPDPATPPDPAAPAPDPCAPAGAPADARAGAAVIVAAAPADPTAPADPAPATAATDPPPAA